MTIAPSRHKMVTLSIPQTTVQHLVQLLKNERREIEIRSQQQTAKIDANIGKFKRRRASMAQQ